MIGKEYVFQKPFDMVSTFAETSNQTPTFFVLFAGVDPTPWVRLFNTLSFFYTCCDTLVDIHLLAYIYLLALLYYTLPHACCIPLAIIHIYMPNHVCIILQVEALGRDNGVTLENGNFKNISMGQGQEKPAEAIVEQYAKSGGWVMLQNLHLMSSWVPKLERLLEVVQETAHPDFRCFISAEPPPMASWRNMPESLMQSSVKVANEAPADIKSNITRGWANFSDERVEACPKKDDFKATLFSLCWYVIINILYFYSILLYVYMCTIMYTPKTYVYYRVFDSP